MAPSTFWRVEDADSQARMEGRRGIYAANQRFKVDWNKHSRWLGSWISKHLNWYSDTPSPFISMSSDRKWVYGEAQRRVRDGKTNVTVYRIEPEGCGMQYRSVARLLENGWLDIEISEEASRPARSEYLVCRHIPQAAIRNDNGWKRNLGRRS